MDDKFTHVLSDDTTTLIIHFLKTRDQINNMRLVSKPFLRKVDQYYLSDAYKKRLIHELVEETGFLVNPKQILADISNDQLNTFVELMKMYKEFKNQLFLTQNSDQVPQKKILSLIKELGEKTNNPVVLTIQCQLLLKQQPLLNNHFSSNTIQNNLLSVPFLLDIDINEKPAVDQYNKIEFLITLARKNGDLSNYFLIIKNIITEFHTRERIDQESFLLMKHQEICPEDLSTPSSLYELIRAILINVGIDLPPPLIETPEDKYKQLISFICQLNWHQAYLYPRQVKDSLVTLLNYFNSYEINPDMQLHVLNFLLESGPNFPFFLSWSPMLITTLFQAKNKTAFNNLIALFFMIKDSICGKLIFNKIIETKLYEKDLQKSKSFIDKITSVIIRNEPDPFLFPFDRHPKLLESIMSKKKDFKLFKNQACLLRIAKDICWSFEEINVFFSKEDKLDRLRWVAGIIEIVTYWPYAEVERLYKQTAIQIYPLLSQCPHRRLIFKKFRSFFNLYNFYISKKIDGMNVLEILCKKNSEILCNWILQKNHTIETITNYIQKNTAMKLLYQFPNPDLLIQLSNKAHPRNFNTNTEVWLISILAKINEAKSKNVDADKYLGVILEKTSKGKSVTSVLENEYLRTYVDTHTLDGKFITKYLEQLIQLGRHLNHANLETVLKIQPTSLMECSAELVDIFFELENQEIIQWMINCINSKNKNILAQLKKIPLEILRKLQKFRSFYCDNYGKWRWTFWGIDILKNCSIDSLLDFEKKYSDDNNTSLLERIEYHGRFLFNKVIYEFKHSNLAGEKFLDFLNYHYDRPWLGYLKEQHCDLILNDFSLASIEILTSTSTKGKYKNYLEFLIDQPIEIHMHLIAATKTFLPSGFPYYIALLDIILEIPVAYYEKFCHLLKHYGYADLSQLYQSKESFIKLLSEQTQNFYCFLATYPTINNELINNFESHLENINQKRKGLASDEEPKSKKFKQNYENQMEEEDLSFLTFNM